MNVPEDLPDVGTEGVVARNEDEEARWEKRATVLARGNSVIRSGTSTPVIEKGNSLETGGGRPENRRTISVGKAEDDVCATFQLFEIESVRFGAGVGVDICIFWFMVDMRSVLIVVLE